MRRRMGEGGGFSRARRGGKETGPRNFKTSEIVKYDESTNQTMPSRPPEGTHMSWQTTCQSLASARTWFLGLPAGLIHSWNHLRRLFTNNFWATCARSGIVWDLASIAQKKESPSGSLSSGFATKETLSQRLTTSQLSCSSRRDSRTLP
jgi:hypothetical protein